MWSGVLTMLRNMTVAIRLFSSSRHHSAHRTVISYVEFTGIICVCPSCNHFAGTVAVKIDEDTIICRAMPFSLLKFHSSCNFLAIESALRSTAFSVLRPVSP